MSLTQMLERSRPLDPWTGYLDRQERLNVFVQASDQIFGIEKSGRHLPGLVGGFFLCILED